MPLNTIIFLHDGRLRAGWRVFLGVAVAMAANWLAAIIARLVTAGHSLLVFDLVYRPLAMALLIGGFCLLLVLADGITENLLAAQGLGSQSAGGKRWWQDALLGIAIGMGLIAAAVAVLAISGHYSSHASFTPRAMLISGPVLAILVAAAMAEEVMFRGYPFQRLVEAIGVWPAVLALSALFACVHWLNPHASAWAMVNTVTVGVLLAIAYLRTRALWLPWGIHFGWNAAMGFIFGLPVSGLDFSVLVKGAATGPQWLTGGSYGLEASALGTMVILLGFLPVLILIRRGEPLPPHGEGSFSDEAGAPVV